MRKLARRIALIAVALALSLVLMPLGVARADVSWGASNSFFEDYREYIKPLDRSFISSSNADSSSIVSSPKTGDVLEELSNGEIVYLSFSCLYDGEFWGFVDGQNQYNEEHSSGWVKISDFLVYYDFIAFEEEHYDEIYEYEGDYSEFAQVDTALMWTWPGSGQYIASIEVQHESISGDSNYKPFQFSYAYRDADGREWGFVASPHISRPGSNSYWICISDPTNRELSAASGNKEPAKWESDTPHIDIATLDSGSVLMGVAPVIALVAALVIGTVILVVVLFRKPEKAESAH